MSDDRDPNKYDKESLRLHANRALGAAFDHIGTDNSQSETCALLAQAFFQREISDKLERIAVALERERPDPVSRLIDIGNVGENSSTQEKVRELQARHVAAKMATDMKRMQRIMGIGVPSDAVIDQTQRALVYLLDKRYFSQYICGFKRDGKWVFALKYEEPAVLLQREKGADPGGIMFSPDELGDKLYYSVSFTPSNAYYLAKASTHLPQATDSDNELEKGGWVNDRIYRAGDIAVRRALIERGQ